MTLLYSAYQSSLATKEGKKKWHPRLLKVGQAITAYEIGLEVAKRSSMSPGDALNVIETMQDVIQQNLLNSRSVCLDRIGTFTIICRSNGNGVDTEEEVSSKQISELKVRFTPTYTKNQYNGTTRAMFNGVTFEKVSKSSVQKSVVPDETVPGGDDEEEYIDPNA